MTERYQNSDTIPITVTALNISGTKVTGLTDVLLTIRRNSDDYYLDFDDNTFKASGWTTRQKVMGEKDATNSAGVYFYDWDTSGFDDDQYHLEVSSITAANSPWADWVYIGAYLGAVWDEKASDHNLGGTFGKFLRQIKEGSISAEADVVDASPTTTTFKTNLTETSSSHYSDLTVAFIGGNLAGQSKILVSYNATDKSLLFDEEWSEAPANGDTFIILTTHSHTITQIVTGILNGIYEGSETLRSFFRLARAVLYGNRSGFHAGHGGTGEFKSSDGTKTRVTSPHDSSGNTKGDITTDDT
jgi:hypothetical protein